MSKVGGRINPNGPLNEESGSILEMLNKLDPEIKRKFYENKRAYMEDWKAFQDWATQGFQVAEQYQGSDYEMGEDSGETSW